MLSKIKEIIYNKKSDEYTMKTKILCGLLYIKKSLDDYSMEIRFLGIRIIFAETIDLIRQYRIAFPKITLFKNNIKKELFKELDEYIPENYDAYCFACRSGEFFLLMHHFKELTTKYQSKNIIILTPFAYHISILKMFFKKIKIIKLPFKFARFSRNDTKEPFNISNNRRIIMPITFNYFQNFEKGVQTNNKSHFYEKLLREHHLSNSNITYPNIAEDTIDSVKRKINMMNIMGKFIILSIGSQSNELLDDDFWIELVKSLKILGYEIYFNSMTNNVITQYGKTCYMTHSEAAYFSNLATATIGLRSGFMDIVAPFSTKTICLYTNFRERRDFDPIDATLVKNAYSLEKIPNAKNIYEITVSNLANEEIITKILEVL